MILQDKNNSPRCWHSFLWLARLTLNTDTVHLTQHEHRCHSFLWLARHGGRQNKARPDRHLKNNSNDSRKTTESVIWKPIRIAEFFPPHQNTSDPESGQKRQNMDTSWLVGLECFSIPKKFLVRNMLKLPMIIITFICEIVGKFLVCMSSANFLFFSCFIQSVRKLIAIASCTGSSCGKGRQTHKRQN